MCVCVGGGSSFRIHLSTEVLRFLVEQFNNMKRCEVPAQRVTSAFTILKKTVFLAFIHLKESQDHINHCFVTFHFFI